VPTARVPPLSSAMSCNAGPGTFCPATPFTDSEYANVSIANAIRSLLIPSTGEEGTFEP